MLRPGWTPHPALDPAGHHFGLREQPADPFDPDRWHESDDYLFGADLFNFCYFWEAHEAWEGIWKASRPDDPAHVFLRGLIQVSAALLKRELGHPQGMLSLSSKGLGRLREAAQHDPAFCGLDLPDWTRRLSRIFSADDIGKWAEDPRMLLG